jgi:hypothetical protein
MLTLWRIVGTIPECFRRKIREQLQGPSDRYPDSVRSELVDAFFRDEDYWRTREPSARLTFISSHNRTLSAAQREESPYGIEGIADFKGGRLVSQSSMNNFRGDFEWTPSLNAFPIFPNGNATHS